MDSSTIIIIIVGIAVAVGIFLLLRLFNCWYFKINKRVELLQSIDNRLQEISRKLDGASPSA